MPAGQLVYGHSSAEGAVRHSDGGGPQRSPQLSRVQEAQHHRAPAENLLSRTWWKWRGFELMYSAETGFRIAPCYGFTTGPNDIASIKPLVSWCLTGSWHAWTVFETDCRSLEIHFSDVHDVFTAGPIRVDT